MSAATATPRARTAAQWTTTPRGAEGFAALLAAVAGDDDDITCGECLDSLAVTDVAAVETCSRNVVTGKPYSLPLCAECAR